MKPFFPHHRRAARFALLLAGLAFGAGYFLHAGDPALKVGDPAPKFAPGKWMQGTPVPSLELGKTYLVEFWATWCGPCIVSIPHLNEIAKRFEIQGLVVIGQDCLEDDEEAVAAFLKKMGDKMTYRVALDVPPADGKRQGLVFDTWMTAAGQNGIPTAFLVDAKGRIAWIGHPMSLKDSVVADILAGTFDVEKEAVRYAEERRRDEIMNDAWRTVNKAMQAEDWTLAEQKLGDFEKLLPETERSSLDRMRFSILAGRGDYAAAYQLAARMGEQHKDEPMYLNDLSWRILTDPKLRERDLALAESLAKQANETSGGKDPAILDTLARAVFLRDRQAEAIALQEKAVTLASDNQKKSLEATLESYRKGRVPEER
ncbi:MAG: redoxin family protein [Verrucomicrobiae bacterium]|nr:redoxin family protein [Verrucomicrobiae bacterium]